MYRNTPYLFPKEGIPLSACGMSYIVTVCTRPHYKLKVSEYLGQLHFHMDVYKGWKRRDLLDAQEQMINFSRNAGAEFIYVYYNGLPSKKFVRFVKLAGFGLIYARRKTEEFNAFFVWSRAIDPDIQKN